jgi:beta-galactosidase/beta-glucuronidase
MWYYLCDKIGMLVWQDAVNSFPYRFITNSALPMLGLKKLNIKKHYASSTKQFYILHTETMVESLKNHPSIVLWTIFNEGWGQFDTEKVYNCVKYIDDTRIIDVASGWFKNTKINEVESLHVYFKPLKCKFKTDKPTIISEFGGYALNIKDHTYAKKAFGYKKIKTIDKFNEEFLKLYERDIINNIHKGLCASIYTQLTDVETEINGIMTYDRKVIKLDEKVANNIKQRLKY